MRYMQFRKAHFIGIAGKGMSATALLLRQTGCEITGSDSGFYHPVSEYLKDAGIAFAEAYKKENIPKNADVIIIGKNAKLTPEENEEVRAAFESGIPVRSFPDILEALTKEKETIVVAGSYGKSTCTALLSWCLTAAGKDPSYFIGEVTRGFEGHAHLGQSDVFVLEGDEYPSSNWDATSKFLHYNPRNVLLTSATHDHINMFPTHESYLAPFRALLAALPKDGLVVANHDERHARALANAYPDKKVFYGLADVPWHAEHIVYGERTTFALVHDGQTITMLTTSLLGRHNIENIVGVSALLLEKGLLLPHELAAGIASFQGVKRRLESLAPRSTVPVFEGFGSSYEKARSAIAAMRQHFPSHRLLVVFEPHTFSWRNRDALPWYDTVFEGAEKVYVYEPAAQGAGTHAQTSHEEIIGRVRAAGVDAFAITKPEEALTLLKNELRPDDALLLLTSGNLGGLIESVPRLAEETFPRANL